MLKINTLIIGGGISGLSTAYNLKKGGFSDFKIITEDIGGRVCFSKDGNVQYGAYYVMEKIYVNTRKFLKLGRKINRSEMFYHKRGETYTILQLSFIKYIPQLIRLIFLLLKFKRHYIKFKKESCFRPQDEVIKSDPYLLYVYETNAEKYMKEHGISDIVHRYMEEVLHGTTFTKVNKINTFSFLQFSLPLITSASEFTLDKDKIIEGFRENIILDTVTSIKKTEDGHLVKTLKEEYLVKNVVVATPPNVSTKLLHMKELKGGVDAYMFHIVGQAKVDWQETRFNLFSDENDMLAIAFMADKSCLFYSKKSNPDLDKYFYDYKVIEKKFWNPAFNLEGGVLWPSKIEDGLLLIGDHNVCDIDDAFITGIFAANQILKNK